MSLYNITHVSTAAMLREYALPEAWKNSVIGFCPNTSPKSPFSVSADALFYAAPENRIVVLSATPDPLAHSRNPLCNWLFIKESYLKYPGSRRDPSQVAWSQWAQYCLIKDIGSSITRIRGPYVVGTRVVYLELEQGLQRGSPSTARLHAVEFAPFADSTTSLPWFWAGSRAMLIPSETSRSIAPATTEGLHVEDIRITEDNIILFTVRLFLYTVS